MTKAQQNKASKLLTKLGLEFTINEESIRVSGESGNYHLHCDYYRQQLGGWGNLSDELTDGLEKIGCFIEWQDPGTLNIHEA